MNKSILLSFDIEEFDIPEEYGQRLDEQVQLAVSRQGLKAILVVLDKLQIRATFFVTANFAGNHQELIKTISQSHEIASHGFYHSQFNIAHLKTSREYLEKLIGKKIIGFRMPRLQKIDESEIFTAGYEYNSSLNPTYLPGRYNNFFKPRTPYYSNNLINIPVSVTPLIRFPLFWLSFKNFPLWLYKLASLITLRHDKYISLYFHPWEFTDITRFKLPNYIKNTSGEVMIYRLEKYLKWLNKQGEFICFSEFIEKYPGVR
jgi:peptidoglycan/xylan/chitin deacetylase (PgdA/CDA1 family)